jgi:hypothetical protein
MIVDGKRMGLYHEGGMVCVVEVIEDKSDDEWERFILECKRIIQSSRIFKDPEIGEQWNVDRTKGDGGAYAGWYLEEEGERVCEVIEK